MVFQLAPYILILLMKIQTAIDKTVDSYPKLEKHLTLSNEPLSADSHIYEDIWRK